MYTANKDCRDEREKIKKEFTNVFEGKTNTQIEKAIDRVLLCQAQGNKCAYSNRSKGNQTPKEWLGETNSP